MRYQKEPHTPGGIRLRALREICGKTQLDVELDADLGIGYLQRLELGKVQHPERNTLERILAALAVSFVDRREVLELFGYVPAISIPDETEIQWAIGVFQSEVRQDGIPTYLLDCTHRLLAWNTLVPNLYGELKAKEVKIPKLIFDPINGIAASILNSDVFFSTQIRIMQYEKQRCCVESWYSSFINEMRQLSMFEEYWIKQSAVGPAQVSMRPMAQLKLDMGYGLANFQLISEVFAQDHRFRVMHCMPADSVTIRYCLEWQD